MQDPEEITRTALRHATPVDARGLAGGLTRVLVAVPCFNEELAVGGVILRAKRYADEVLVLDDGSSDRTTEVAELAGATVLQNPGNKGKGYSVRRAFQYAAERQYDVLVLIDGDGQHDADEIPLLLEPVIGRNGSSVDIALGFRYGDKTEMPLWRRAGKRLLDYATALATETTVTDSQMGFRAFGPKAIHELATRLQADGFSVESEQLQHAKEAGLTWDNVLVHCRYEGIDGSTKGPVAHAAGVMMNLVDLATAKRPLMFIGLPSVALVVGAVAMGIYTLQSYNATKVFSVGYALMTATVGLIGVFGLLTAIVLNLLSRLERRLRHRPLT